MNNFKTAIIMAGGKGDRMFPVSDYVPKPLVKINNIPLIDHCIESLKRSGIEQIYVTYGYKSEMLVSHIEKKVNGLINTIGKNNSYFLSNTIVKNINEPTIIMPCDIIMSVDFCKLFNEYKSPRSYIIPIKYKDGMNADYITTDKFGRVKKIDRNSISPYCASGIQICIPSIINKLDLQPDDDWYNIWNKLINKKQLFITKTETTEWKTYNYLEELLKTNDNSTKIIN